MPKWPIERWIAIIAVVLSVGSYAQVLRDTREDVAKHEAFIEEKLPLQYVPREVYDLDRMHLAESVDRLNGTLKELQQTIRGPQQRQPSNLERMFDR